MQFVDPYDKRITCEEDYISPPWLALLPITSTSFPTSSSGAGGPAVTPDVPVPPFNPCLLTEAGFAYLAGPYDSFEGYTIGATPTDKGFGWAGPWQIFNAYERTLVAHDFDSHADGSADGTTGGSGWSAGWSADGGGVTPPIVFPTGLTLRLESDDFDATADLTPIATWVDKTGLLNGRNYASPAHPSQSPWVDAVQTLGGHNTLRFIFSTATRQLIGAANTWLTALTAADIFVVMKKDNDPAVSSAASGDSGAPFQFNRQSGLASRVSFTDGHFYEHFGSATRLDIGNPVTSITSWTVYNLRNSSATNQLVVYVGTELVYNAAQAWVALGTSVNRIGASPEGADQFSFGGNIAAVYGFDHILNGTERADFQLFLSTFWGVTTSAV